MSTALVIARDALRGFAFQKLVLVVVLATGMLTFGMAQLSSWQRESVESALAAHQAESDASVQTRSAAERLKAQREEAALAQMHGFQQSMFLGAASFGGSIVALLLCSTVFASPLRRGETRGVLARPVSRSSYVLGRWLAAVVALAAYWLAMSAAFSFFFHSAGAELPTWMRWAPLLLFCKGVMLGSVALALSTFMRPPFAAAVAFFASSDWTSSKGVFYLILPGDDRLNVWWQLLRGSPLSIRDVLLAATYALVVAAVGVGFALIRFRRMDVI